MSYTVESIDSNTPSAPIQTTAQVMKEEKVIGAQPPNRLAEAQARVAERLGQTNTNVETPKAEESKPATEESVKLSPHMAALARKEQKFRQEQHKLKTDRAALDAEKAEVAELKTLREKLAAKDYSGIESQLSYEEYTQYLINKDKGTNPEQQALKKLEDEVNGLKKSQEENVSKQFEAAVNERRQAVNKLVETNPEFARIKKANMQETVVKHILDTWEHDSVELSVEDALKEVNEALIERAKKWAALLEEEQAPTIDGEKKQLPPMKQGIKTLTNQMTTGDVKRAVRPLHTMSEGERYAEARRRAEEKLKLQGKI